jgi:AraC family transcriptional regulator
VLEHLHSSTLFSSCLVTISDWCCRPTEPAFGAEEESSGHVLIFPRTGLFVERRGDRDDVVGDPTRVLFFKPKELYRVAHPVSGGDDCTSIRFNDAAVIAFGRRNETSPFQLRSVASPPTMTLVLHRLRQNLLRRRAADPLAIEEAAASLLIQAGALVGSRHSRKQAPRRAETRQAHRDLAYAARVALAKKFREKVTLDSLARAVFSSPFHLARVFQRETGITLHAQLNRLRLRRALDEIADGVPDLTRLALELGFSSHAHFTHAFIREFGQPPSTIRRFLSSTTLRKANRKIPG